MNALPIKLPLIADPKIHGSGDGNYRHTHTHARSQTTRIAATRATNNESTLQKNANDNTKAGKGEHVESQTMQRKLLYQTSTICDSSAAFQIEEIYLHDRLRVELPLPFNSKHESFPISHISTSRMSRSVKLCRACEDEPRIVVYLLKTPPKEDTLP